MNRLWENVRIVVLYVLPKSSILERRDSAELIRLLELRPLPFAVESGTVRPSLSLSTTHTRRG
jgi:hypothetical protein